MRLVRIKLLESPFWFLSKAVKLDLLNPTSDFINIDSLSQEYIDIINRSVNASEIKIFDGEGARIRDIKSVSFVSGDLAVSTEDVEEDETDYLPEMVSVTSSDEEEEEEDSEPSDADFDAAKLLLNKNGNVVKKVLKELHGDEGLMILHACLLQEESDKNRPGVINSIEEAIGGF